MKLTGAPIDLDRFLAALTCPEPVVISNSLRKGLVRDRAAVLRHAAADQPVYGLNTGLGANLGHRIDPAAISAFQAQIIAGRDTGTGPDLPVEAARGVLLARIISAAGGRSGLNPVLFDHLCAVFAAGLVPQIPEWGSIGASDLTQNAAMAAAVTGQVGFLDGQTLHQRGLSPPALGPKDAMCLINHSGVTVARAALALGAARRQLTLIKAITALSYLGYGANRTVLRADLNALRAAPGQAAAAAYFERALSGAKDHSRRIQEALSFRTVAPVIGAAQAALDQAVTIWQDELNGSSDSPAILPDGSMQSTANFHSPALALSLEQVSQAMAMVAAGSLQRVQRLMNPDLTGLPRYLSPVGGASAGLVPMQKTAAALLAEIRQAAQPVIFDAAPVSDTVEDVAPMTPLAAAKLDRQMRPFASLAAVEALTAAQAVDLRGLKTMPQGPKAIYKAVRAVAGMVQADRPLRGDLNAVTGALLGFDLTKIS